VGMAQTVPSEAVSVGSIGLRGGFDSNPTDTPGAHGSLSVTQTVSYDYLRGSLQDGIALKLRATDTIYDPNVVAPSTNVVAAATVATRIAPNPGVSATLTTMIDGASSALHAIAQSRRIRRSMRQIASSGPNIRG